MNEKSEMYLAPELLPKYIFTKEESRAIKNLGKLELKDWLLLLAGTVVFLGVPTLQSIYTYYLYGSIEVKKVILNFITANPLGILCLVAFIFEIYSRSMPIHCQGAARGIVVKREVIHQTVHIKSNNELMPYQRPGMPEYREKPASYYSDRKSQPFYYLTIQLENSDKQLRYVNCTKKTFDHLRLGEMVLAVYYGNDRLIGYQIKSEEH